MYVCIAFIASWKFVGTVMYVDIVNVLLGYFTMNVSIHLRYTLITTCWEVKSNDRPTFKELVAKIEWFKQLKENIEETDSDTYITNTIT